MENERVRKIVEILKLKRNIVGIHFLVCEKDFQECDAEIFKGRLRLCGFVNKANYGAKMKVKQDNFACMGAAGQTGLIQPAESFLSGQRRKHSGLYSDLGIAREVSESFKRIPYSLYGMEIGPLEDMDSADVVIILGMAEQIMKIMQGYTWHYGTPHNLVSVGNAAMCSDMVSKPFMNNDINLSLMCCGARTSTISEEGELGVGMPSHIFKQVADGILKIYN